MLYNKFKNLVLFEIENNISRNKYSYIYGLFNGNSFGTIRECSNSFDEYEQRLTFYSKWDKIFSIEESEIVTDTSNGEDLEGNTDLDFIPEGYQFLKYCLERAFKLKRPDYAIFYLLGEILGWKNSGRISEEQYNKLNNILPKDFIERNQQELGYLNNIFDESNW